MLPKWQVELRNRGEHEQCHTECAEYMHVKDSLELAQPAVGHNGAKDTHQED